MLIFFKKRIRRIRLYIYLKEEGQFFYKKLGTHGGTEAWLEVTKFLYSPSSFQ